MLGVNVFNGKYIMNVATSDVKGMVDLVMNNHPWQDGMTGAPALYVWGVNEASLGGTPLGIFDGGTPTPTNRGSMMLLLVWLKGIDMTTPVVIDNIDIGKCNN